MKFSIKSVNNFFTSRILGYMGMAAILFSAVACDDDDDNVVEPDPIAYVSLYQASPDAPNLNIVVDNRQINTYPFDYAEYTGYLRFNTGERTLQFSPFDAK